jgi:hypothetical protein
VVQSKIPSSKALPRWDPTGRTELVARLADGSCPVCRFRDGSVDRFFAWFMIETYTEPEMIGRLCAARGMCPSHTRRLLSEAPVASTPNLIYECVVRWWQERSARSAPIDPCPACEVGASSSLSAVNSLAPHLLDRDVVGAYRSNGGVCASHLEMALTSVGPELAGTVARQLGDRLRGGPGDPVAAIAASEEDATRRVALRELLPDDPSLDADDPDGTLRSLHRRLEIRACPICLAEGSTARRYLAWVRDTGRSEGWTPDAAPPLCDAHLRDLVSMDPDAGRWAGRRMADPWLAALQRFAAALERLPRPSLAERVRALPESRRRLAADRAEGALARNPWLPGRTLPSTLRNPRHAYAEAIAWLGASRARCAACVTLADVVARQGELLVWALRDRPTSRRYERSHGLCVHHAASIRGALDRPLIDEVLSARLAVLGWELGEASRKRSWSLRHEPSGAETTAWLRAPALLDGRVFEGGPAVVPARWAG